MPERGPFSPSSAAPARRPRGVGSCGNRPADRGPEPRSPKSWNRVTRTGPERSGGPARPRIRGMGGGRPNRSIGAFPKRKGRRWFGGLRLFFRDASPVQPELGRTLAGHEPASRPLCENLKRLRDLVRCRNDVSIQKRAAPRDGSGSTGRHQQGSDQSMTTNRCPHRRCHDNSRALKIG